MTNLAIKSGQLTKPVKFMILLCAMYISCQSEPKDQRTGGSGDDTQKATSHILIHLAFDAYPAADVKSFKIYGGKSEQDLVTLIDDYAPSDSSFDFSHPLITLDSATVTSLTPLLGDSACFKLTATKGDQESTSSNVVCADL